ncbi:unnamed protein product, partial [Ectocarpus sp. 12 AP-2014]
PWRACRYSPAKSAMPRRRTPERERWLQYPPSGEKYARMQACLPPRRLSLADPTDEHTHSPKAPMVVGCTLLHEHRRNRSTVNRRKRAKSGFGWAGPARWVSRTFYSFPKRPMRDP